MLYHAIQREETLPEPKVRTQGIDHIALHVSDLEESRRFYIELLGFTPYFEVEGHIFLRTGSCQVGLFEARDHDVHAYTEVDHLAIRSEDSEEEIKKVMTEAGIELIPRPEGLGWPATQTDAIYFKDPDGHVLQLLPKGKWPQVELKPTVHVRNSNV